MLNTKKIWRVLIDNDYKSLAMEINPSESLNISNLFKSNQKLVDKWITLSVNINNSEEDRNKPLSDFISGFVVIAISAKTKEVVEEFIKDQVEFLPLRSGYSLFYALNVKYIDCLNTSESVIKYFNKEKKIMRVEKYSLFWEKLIDEHIFRIPELGLSRLFVSDAFKYFIESNKLTGLLFDPISTVS